MISILDRIGLVVISCVDIEAHCVVVILFDYLLR